MAGKVQHEIPQLYQLGFQIPSTDGKEQIYVYRRGAKPFISAINRSGAQSYFYSEPSKDGIRTLDDEITDYEGHLTTLVNELRSVEAGGQANATTAAEVISHLTTRNAHLRGAFAHGLTTMADSFTELFSDEDAVRRLIGLEGPGVTDTFRSHVVDRLAQQLMADMGDRSVVVVEAAVTDGLWKRKGQTLEASGNELRPTSSAFSIPVHFHGTFEEGVPKRISDALSDLLREVAWTVPGTSVPKPVYWLHRRSRQWRREASASSMRRRGMTAWRRSSRP